MSHGDFTIGDDIFEKVNVYNPLGRHHINTNFLYV